MKPIYNVSFLGLGMSCETFCNDPTLREVTFIDR